MNGKPQRRRTWRAWGLLAVVAAAVFGVMALMGSAHTQAVGPVHTFGIAISKSVQTDVHLGEVVQKTIKLENLDVDHGVLINTLTDQFPQGTGPIVNVSGCATKLALSDGVPGSGPDFTSCGLKITIPNDPSLCGTGLQNQVVVTFTDQVLTTLHNTNQASGVYTIRCPDVKVVKTAKTPKVDAGQDAVYNITVTAIGNEPSTNVVLTDGGLDVAKVAVGGADANLCLPIASGTLTCNFGTLDPAGISSRTINLTHHTSTTQCPAISNTAHVTADFDAVLSNNTSGPVVIRVNNCPVVNPPISKCTLQDLVECIRLGNPHLANLWLCQPVATCANPAAGEGEVDFNLNLGGPVRGLDPKCLATAPDPTTCPRQSIGSFQFEVRYDSKLVTLQVEPGSLWRDAAGNLLSNVSCATIPTQNGIQFRCNIKGKTLVLYGPGTLAVVRVRATSDVYSILIPNQQNGIVTQLINQDCNLSDLQGHPIKLAGQTLPGVGPAVCDDADVTIRYLEGDVNADCEVNVQDQQLIAFRWGSHLGSLLYNSRYDLEPAAPKKGDGDIDAKDLQVVFGRHTSPNSTCAAPHPAQDPVDPKAIPTPTPPPA
jgi:hypothetical protein